MADQVKWLERKFEYKAPVGEFPCILTRLRGTPARLDEMLKSIPEEVLCKQVDGGWSIKEQVGHLEDVEELLDNRIDDFISGEKTLHAADMSNKRTNERRHNEKTIKALLDSFRATRMGIVNRLDEMNKETIARSAIHPRLNKPMRVTDMMFFFAEHDDHHLAIIMDLIKKLN